MRYGEDTLADVDHAHAEARGVRRRGAQPPGLGVAAERRARRARAGDRPHVADRDGRAGVRQPVRARRCCRSSRALRACRCPASRPRVVHARRRARAPPNEKGIMVITRPFPGLTPALVGRAGALRARLLGAHSRRVLLGRRGLRGRGRLLLVQRPRRRDHQDRRAPPRHDRGRKRLRHASGRRRMRRRGPARRDARRGHRRLRAAQARLRGLGRAATGDCSTRCGASWGPWPSSAS